jgi:hypothetical protein
MTLVFDPSNLFGDETVIGDKSLDDMLASFHFGRYQIYVRLNDGHIHPATGEGFMSDDLSEASKHCDELRSLRPVNDYVVIDSKNYPTVVYPKQAGE